MKIKIESDENDIEAEAMFKKTIKKFGAGSGHVLIPHKYVGQEAIVIIKEIIGSWAGGMKKSMKRKGLNK